MKNLIAISAACISLLTASSSFAALEGPGGYRLDRGNVEGWGMMNRAERAEHRNKMHSFKTEAECKAYQEEHHKRMEQRASEKGKKLAKPRHDACGMMKSRGMLQ